MREIKFRGKNTINGNFVEGYYNVDKGHHNINSGHTVYPIHPWSVGQFTGLTDKNGKEVYEGDVIKIDGSNRVLFVEYKNGCFYSTNNQLGTNYRIGGWEKGSFEIIGNIHENPELLNQ